MSGMKAIGTLRMVSLQKKAYTQDDLRLLDIISDLAAVSLMNSRLYQQTNELAIKDGLTGLYVQRFFKEQLEVKVREAQRSGAVLAILMVDLDHFKTHNDKYGHMAGDLLLGRVAEVLRDRIGTGHIISRYGGEEFAVILTDTDHKKALAIAQNVRKGIEEADFIVRRERVKMTVSVGVSCFPKDAATPAALLKIADSNLYMAKEGGRNKVCSNS
jgi:diguanylate cyclase (GGDEF)-like protein